MPGRPFIRQLPLILMSGVNFLELKAFGGGRRVCVKEAGVKAAKAAIGRDAVPDKEPDLGTFTNAGPDARLASFISLSTIDTADEGKALRQLNMIFYMLNENPTQAWKDLARASRTTESAPPRTTERDTDTVVISDDEDEEEDSEDEDSDSEEEDSEEEDTEEEDGEEESSSEEGEGAGDAEAASTPPTAAAPVPVAAPVAAPVPVAPVAAPVTTSTPETVKRKTLSQEDEKNAKKPRTKHASDASTRADISVSYRNTGDKSFMHVIPSGRVAELIGLKLTGEEYTAGTRPAFVLGDIPESSKGYNKINKMARKTWFSAPGAWEGLQELAKGGNSPSNRKSIRAIVEPVLTAWFESATRADIMLQLALKDDKDVAAYTKHKDANGGSSGSTNLAKLPKLLKRLRHHTDCAASLVAELEGIIGSSAEEDAAGTS